MGKMEAEENQFLRTQWLLGEAAMERLKKARVAVFGIGGVGGYVAEALARSGVFSLDLIDKDVVSLTNLNRQIELVLKELAKDNPQGIIHFNEIYAGINMLRRVPPRMLYAILMQEESIKQIDKMSFKLIDQDEE